VPGGIESGLKFSIGISNTIFSDAPEKVYKPHQIPQSCKIISLCLRFKTFTPAQGTN
jgi:hypothetical protein